MAMEITMDNFEQEVLNSDVPVMIDFWATWCMPCKMLAPVIEELAEEANGAYKVGKIDVDRSPSLAAQFGVMSIPTVIVFKNGKAAEKSVGVVPKNQLEAMLK
ncbi:MULTISPECIES: thioredoxin [unclassified Blautia]|uniref:Thioredoxin n=1 Tax=Candidatus Blautia merdigallinarum TaxID=2838495 RepID=A0A9D2N5Z7_9FIRM|nr:MULTISPECIES: thioredoxin [unclassified Blautia]OUN31150.1 thioredoxin [Blautia sp. An81]OUN92733.1 thioredoxin [Blautia sp. An46]HJC11032.1 thioredoxin [Candidatus Blautia merdigallinarum]HJD37739.1 thioredoxin [Candidatus Blautia ornithocaccae]